VHFWEMRYPPTLHIVTRMGQEQGDPKVKLILG